MNVGSPLWHATTQPRPARGGGRPCTGRRARGAWALGMATSLVAVALITLTPQGSGWAWGSPLDEARWYLTGLDSTATIEQLAGNLLLVIVSSGLTSAHWPALNHPSALASVTLAAYSTIAVVLS